jgi:hypothetical protein
MAATDDGVRVLRPGERAFLAVEILDWPHGDVTNVRIEARGFRLIQSLWVPTACLLRTPYEVAAVTP